MTAEELNNNLYSGEYNSFDEYASARNGYSAFGLGSKVTNFFNGANDAAESEYNQYLQSSAYQINQAKKAGINPYMLFNDRYPSSSAQTVTYSKQDKSANVGKVAASALVVAKLLKLLAFI